MGLPNFHTQADGVLPILVMNTIFSVVLIKNLLKSIIRVVGSYGYSINFEEGSQKVENRGLVGKVSVVSGLENGSCCTVCLCRFKDGEEVTELSCNHVFHKQCLGKWFDNHHRTCPLCRTMF